jgi:hypothetical protein
MIAMECIDFICRKCAADKGSDCRPPGGKIFLLFHWWQYAVNLCLFFLKKAKTDAVGQTLFGGPDHQKVFGYNHLMCVKNRIFAV